VFIPQRVIPTPEWLMRIRKEFGMATRRPVKA
jgi:hypothetical protein